MKLLHGFLTEKEHYYEVRTAGDGEIYRIPVDISIEDSIEIDRDTLLIVNLSNEDILDDYTADREPPNEALMELDETEARENNNEMNLIWKSSRNPTIEDVNATKCFLALRNSEKYERMFNDKKNPKLKIWKMISDDMKNTGFFVENGKEGTKKCAQKYYNLQKTYLSIKKKTQRTGESRQALPVYFDEMEKLFSTKHNVNPVLLIDSFATENHSDNETVITERPNRDIISNSGNNSDIISNSGNNNSDINEIVNVPTSSNSTRSGKTSKSDKNHSLERPKSNMDKVLTTISQCHKEQMDQKRSNSPESDV